MENLRAALGHHSVLADPEELLVYECDGLPHHKYRPRAVVFPNSTEETAETMRLLALAGVPFTPRGAGTGLSGGALALNSGIVIELARMRKILSIDRENRLAIVQTGVVNSRVSRAVAHLGLHYVPDPSSQPTCTIGGNIAENAGGIHCLKYGTTTDHVIGARVVLAGGEIVDLEGASGEGNGYDLLGVFVGSEGTFGIATEATLRLTPMPPAVRTLLADFVEVNNASHAVSAIIAAGVMPAALEMMDREIIRAVEASVFAAGLPTDAGAALLIELDGLEAGLDDETNRVAAICLQNGARSCRRARDENERKKLWAARKGAFGAVGRIAPDSMIQDAVVPRSRLPEVLSETYRIAAKHQLVIANVFHAGDGNLHPLICFDSRSPEEVRQVKEAGRELMEVCVRAGGSITGEHGVGLDKREYFPLTFSEVDMETMLKVREAFDPSGLCNPGKIIPTPRGCGEGRAVARFGSSERWGDGETRGRGDTVTEGEGSDAQVWNADAASKRSDPAALRPPFSPSPCPPVSVSRSQVVAPSSVEEAIEIVKNAAAEKFRVIPAGARALSGLAHESVSQTLARKSVANSFAHESVTQGLAQKSVTQNLDQESVGQSAVVISTGRLNRLIEHEPADLIATAQAGMRLEEFNSHLAQQGQWLPLDPPDDGSATLGGVIATGLSGPFDCGYGPPRKYVIGMKVVTANGEVVKAGGKVVKNVAGYDLCKLFTGSYGTLGLIIELTFKLRPRPEKEATLALFGPVGDLLDAAFSILNEPLFPVCLELMSAAAAHRIGLSTKNGECALLVRFNGSGSTVAYQIERATILTQNKFGNNVEVHQDDQSLWQKLRTVTLVQNEAVGWHTAVKPSEIARFVDSLSRTQDFRSLIWHAGVASGRIRGSGLSTLDDAFGVRYSAPLQLMNRIKQQLDPAGIFRCLEEIHESTRNHTN